MHKFQENAVTAVVRLRTKYIYYIYLTKKELDGFYFSVISWYFGSPTYHR